MKILFSIALVALTHLGFAQNTETTTIWKNAIQPLIANDMDEVVSHTNFPVATFAGNWDEVAFRANMESILSEGQRKAMKTLSADNLVKIEEPTGEVAYMLAVHEVYEMDGDIFESSVMYYFWNIEGIWKLAKIDMAG